MSEVKSFQTTAFAVSGFLMALGFCFKSLWPLAFFVLTPAIFLFIKAKKKISLFKAMTVYYISYYFIVNIWITNISEYAFNNFIKGKLIMLAANFIISIILSLTGSLPFLFCKKFNVVAFPLLFITGEWLQGLHDIIGFPWGRVCNIITPFTVFIQSASLLGGLFISFLVILLNCFFAWILIYKMEYIKLICLVTAIISSNFIYGFYRLSIFNNSNPNNVVIVQGNYPKEEKWNNDAEEILNTYIEATEKNISNNTNLVVFPETAFPFNFFESNKLSKRLYDLSSDHNITILLGLQYSKDGKTYNSMIAIEPDNNISDIYMKQRLVPFGEYTPFEKILKFRFTECPFSSGTESVILNTEAGKISCAICFESVFPEISRQSVLKGGEAIAVLTNDSWLGNTIPLYQHHSHSIMRAVENNRYVITGTNTGISSVITNNGYITNISDINKSEVISSSYELIDDLTLYSKTGDIIVIPGIIIMLMQFAKCVKTYCNKLKYRL